MDNLSNVKSTLGTHEPTAMTNYGKVSNRISYNDPVTQTSPASHLKNCSPFRNASPPKHVTITADRNNRTLNDRDVQHLNQTHHDMGRSPLNISRGFTGANTTQQLIYEAPKNDYQDLYNQIEIVRAERDKYAKETHVEKMKNQELEKEFKILRSLINESKGQAKTEANLQVQTMYEREKAARITAESDLSILRQQLADAMTASRKESQSLKKALSEMQQQNQVSMRTIYEKQDQNLSQMDQLEDLSRIIQEKD